MYNLFVGIFRIFIIFFLFFLSFFPIQTDPHIQLFIIPAGFLILVLVLSKSGNRFFDRNLLNLLFLIFLTASLNSAFFSVSRQESFDLLVLYLTFFIFFNVAGRIFNTLRSKEFFCLSLILLTIILSLVSLYNTLILHYVNKDTAGTSFFWIYYGHNHLSALLLFTIPLAFYFLYKFRTTGFGWLKILLFLVLVASLLFSFSKGSNLSLIFSGLISTTAFNLVSKKNLILFTVSALLFVWIFLTFVQPVGQFFGVKRIGWGDSGRTIYWELSVWNGITNPFTGTGLDTVRYLPPPKNLVRSDYSHNFFIQLFSDGGIPLFVSGCILFIVLFFVLYERIAGFKKNSNPFFFSIAVWTGLLASAINSLIDFDWHLPVVFLVFWLLSGFIYAKD